MKFSIITPEHKISNAPFLKELYLSILSQTYTDWEWILYLNGEVHLVDIPIVIQKDARVKIYRQEDDNSDIGMIKNRAFHLGEGDILVEVDHDDVLLENCLEELYKAYQDDEVGFVYSKNIKYGMEEPFVPYNPLGGWTWKNVKWKEHNLISMDCFPPTSHSLAYIWYAPDHVRSWRKDIYTAIGGHDITYNVCDDMELLHRTWLATKMHYIDKDLYVYRITGENEWIKRNALIQSTTRALFDKNIRAIVEKEANEKNLLKIDLGGGLNPYPNYKTVDIRKNADIVADLNEGIPLEDNSVWIVNAHHILEHLKDPIKSMREIHRVLAPGGWAFIEVPSTDGRGAFQDPTHVSFWNSNSFFYYTRKDYAKFIDNEDIRFQVYKMDNYYPTKFMEQHNILVTCAVLVAVKGEERFPGELHI